MVVEPETESVEFKLTDIQSWWQVASVVHYSSVFRQAFQLPEFNFEDFEDALLKDKPGSENLFLSYLTIDILKGCLSTDDISLLVFNDRLRDYLNSNAELCNDVQYSLNCGKCFDDLSTFKKVCLINSLCDCRLLTTDAYEKTVDIDADALRIEPLGTDAKGNTYWYFFGSRLYKESAPCQKPPHVSEEKSPKKKKKRKRNSKSESSFAPDFLEPSKDDLYGDWSLVASTMDEWESLAEELKQSKRSRDQELYCTINENFLPVLPSVIASEEKLKLNRLKELEESRQSARIEEKRKEQELLEAEQEAMKRAEENKKREALRKAAKREEEEKQKAADLEKAQKEEAKALLREERQKRASMREERATLLLEGKPIPPHLTGATLDSPVPSPTHSLDDGCSMSSGGDAVNGTNASAKKTGSLAATSSRKRYSEFLTDDDSMDEEETNLAMMKVLSELEVHKDIAVFEKPVTEEIAPGYTSVIKNPICLEDIYKRLRANFYKSKQTFIESCLLMFENCWQYNGKLSEYGQIATDVRKLFVDAAKRHLALDVNSSRKTMTSSQPTGTQPKRRRKVADQQVPVWYSESEEECGVHNTSSSEIDSPVKVIGGKLALKTQNGIISQQPSPSRHRRKQTLPSESQRRQSALNARVQQTKTLRFWPEIDFGVKSTDRLPSLMRNDYTPNKGNMVPMTLEKLALKNGEKGASPEIAIRDNMHTTGFSYNQPNGFTGKNSIPQAPIMTYSHNPAARVIMVGVKKPMCPASQSQSTLQQQVSSPYNKNISENSQAQRDSLGFSSPYMSKIVDVQNKEKQLTARLQQHTQETVKNFLRVARNPECNSVVFPGYIPHKAANISTSPAMSQCSPKTPPVVCEPLAQRVVVTGNVAKFGHHQPQNAYEGSFCVNSTNQNIIQTNLNHKTFESHANVPVSQVNSTPVGLMNSPVRTVTILRKSPSNVKETNLADSTSALLTQTPIRDSSVVNQTPVRSLQQSSPQIFDRSYASNLVKNLSSPECSKLVFNPIVSHSNSVTSNPSLQSPTICNGKAMQFTTIGNLGNTPIQSTTSYRHSSPQASPLVTSPNEQTSLSKVKNNKFIFVVPPKTPQMQAAKEVLTPSWQQPASAPSKFIIGKNLTNGSAVMFTPLTQLTTPGQVRPTGGKVQPLSSSTPVKIPVMSPQPTVAALLQNSPKRPVMKSNEVVVKNGGDCSVSFCDNKSLPLKSTPKPKVSSPSSVNNYDAQKFIPRSPFANKPQKVRKHKVASSSSTCSNTSTISSKTENAQHETSSSGNNLNGNTIKTVSGNSSEMAPISAVTTSSVNNGLVNNNTEEQKTIPVVQSYQTSFAESEIPGNIPDVPQQKSCNTNNTTVNFEVAKTLNSQKNTSTYEAVKNSQAISSNEQLPLSGNPRMSAVFLHLHPG